MNPGDTESREGGTTPGGDENVVRFPREWIGPLEDLVPIRSLAEDDSSLDDEAPPGADAFWTENASALHDAIQAPAPPASAPPASVPPASEEPGRHPPAERDQRRRRMALRAPAGRRLSGPVRRAPGTPRHHLRRRLRIGPWPSMPIRWLVAAVIGVPLVVVAVIGTVWSGDGGTSRPTAVAQSGRVDVQDQARGVTVPPAAAHRVSHQRQARLRSSSARRRSSGRTRARIHRKQSAPPTSHTSAFSVSSHVSSPEPVTSPASGYSSPTGATQSPTTTSPTSTTPRQSSTTSGTGSSPSSASSGGTAAFGPAGALGPGSSPAS